MAIFPVLQALILQFFNGKLREFGMFDKLWPLRFPFLYGVLGVLLSQQTNLHNPLFYYGVLAKTLENPLIARDMPNFGISRPFAKLWNRDFQMDVELRRMRGFKTYNFRASQFRFQTLRMGSAAFYTSQGLQTSCDHIACEFRDMPGGFQTYSFCTLPCLGRRTSVILCFLINFATLMRFVLLVAELRCLKA